MNDKNLWKLARASILVAVAGSIWATISMNSCAACRGAASAIGTHYLGVLGACFYGALALLMFFRQPGRLAKWGIFFACGVHLVLVGILHREHLLCVPCLLTASAALIAGLTLLASDDFRWKVHTVPFFTAFGLTLALATMQAKAQQQARLSDANALLVRTQAGNIAVANGKLRLIVFERKGCHYCEQFEQSYLPVLKQRFGAALEVEVRPAPADLPTPSFVLAGRQQQAIVGLPSLQEIQQALEKCLQLSDAGGDSVAHRI